MEFRALATDYDGTVAYHGEILPRTLDALQRLKRSGRTLLLVTGREIPDLRRVCPHMEMFDLVVGENGALLYWPADDRTELLATPPPRTFAERLVDCGVDRLSVGQVVVATWVPFERVAQRVIDAMGLPLQVIMNKDAVMVLPRGVDKATGLVHALERLGVSAETVVGVGDAENDHVFLTACALSAAVDNALPELKRQVDVVTQASHGDGVAELIDGLMHGGLLERVKVRGSRG